MHRVLLLANDQPVWIYLVGGASEADYVTESAAGAGTGAARFGLLNALE